MGTHRDQFNFADGHEEIERRAYELWQARGRPLGSPEVDWFEAEADLQREVTWVSEGGSAGTTSSVSTAETITTSTGESETVSETVSTGTSRHRTRARRAP